MKEVNNSLRSEVRMRESANQPVEAARERLTLLVSDVLKKIIFRVSELDGFEDLQPYYAKYGSRLEDIFSELLREGMEVPDESEDVDFLFGSNHGMTKKVGVPTDVIQATLQLLIQEKVQTAKLRPQIEKQVVDVIWGAYDRALKIVK